MCLRNAVISVLHSNGSVLCENTDWNAVSDSAVYDNEISEEVVQDVQLDTPRRRKTQDLSKPLRPLFEWRESSPFGQQTIRLEKPAFHSSHPTPFWPRPAPL